jgi:hypothetical protein
MSLLILGTTAALAGCGSDDPSPSADSVVTTTVAASPDTTEESAPPTTEASTTAESTPATDSGHASSEFCTTAAEAEELGDEVDGAFADTPAQLEAVVTAALEASQATLELAPPDIADAMQRTVEFQQRFAALLGENGWDATKAFATPEGAKLLADSQTADADLEQVRKYLEAHCGIADDSATTDASVPALLPDGDEGLRRFIQLYSIGSGVDVTDEQEDCFVDELSGKVDSAQLEEALSDEADEEVKIAVGVAVLACDIAVSVDS